MVSSAVAIMAVLLLPAVVTGNNCEVGWQYNPQTDKCYKFYDEQESWPMSEIYCQFKAAHHVSVHSPQDIEFIRNLTANSQAQNIWIGAAQFGFSKEYENVDKTPFDHESWLSGVRPSYEGGKKCIMMNARTGLWSQSCCKIPAAYVCIRRARLPFRITTIPWSFTTPRASTTIRHFATTTTYPIVFRTTQDFRH